MQSWNRASRFKSHLLLIWNFQMRLEMRCAIWNFLKLEAWNFWNSSWGGGGCLFETFRWDLLWDVLFETFWNLKLFNPSQGLLIWNFSGETWNKMCYLKYLKLETFQTYHGICLFETFRWDLKKDVIFETFGTFWNSICILSFFDNFDTHSIRINITTLIVYFELLLIPSTT